MLWRLLAAAGGVGGLASLAFSYALVAGGVIGVELQEKPYTLFQLARLLEDVGNDPQMVYLLIIVIVVGSTLALVGAAVSSWLAFVGGVVQGGAAAAFAYESTAQGSQTFLLGLAQTDLSLEIGLFILAAASLLSLASLPVSLSSRG